MSTLKRATIKGYTASTHKASVQVAGSLAVWLDSVPVATDIAPAEVVAGRECAVLFFTDDNPDDAVVITVHNAVPAAAAGGAKIADADGDTSVDTEKNADEDKVRITVFATERGLFQTASPHITLTGDLQIASGFATIGSGGAIDAQRVVNIAHTFTGLTGTGLGVKGIALYAESRDTTNPGGLNSGARAIEALASNDRAAGTALDIQGMAFTAQQNGVAGAANFTGIKCVATITATAAGAVSNLYGYQVEVSSANAANKPDLVAGYRVNFARNAAVESYGLFVQAMTDSPLRHGVRIKEMTSGLAAGQTAYGIKVDDFAASALGNQWPFYYGVDAGVQRFTVDRTGAILTAGTFTGVPSAAQTLAAATAILANATIVQINSAGNVTSTAAPTIANGLDGQILVIVNVDTTDTITLSDQGTLAGSNLRLSTATIALGPRDSLTLTYNATIGDWIEIARSNVI